MTLDQFCDSVPDTRRLLIKKSSARMEWEGEMYEARLSLYYHEDSILFISAVNTGFEIIRAAITPDSIAVINRLDKLVYIYKGKGFYDSSPAHIQDVSAIFNPSELCREADIQNLSRPPVRIDQSEGDIRKIIEYRKDDFALERFEFFHKKTYAYIMGERTEGDAFTIFVNYIIKDLVIYAEGGRILRGEMVSVNMDYNKARYTTIYL